MMLFACNLGTDAQTLNIGDYESIEEWGDYSGEGGNLYDGSSWCCVPFNLVYTNSGTQIIFTKEELADMAGKAITAIRFKAHDGGSYQEITFNAKVYLSETNRGTFLRTGSPQRYRYFDISNAICAFEGEITHDGLTYGYMDCAETDLSFDTPFYYSGNNNLVVTIVANGASETTPGIDYVNFYKTNLSNRAITFSSETTTLDAKLATDLMAASTGVSVIEAPICQFAYSTATTPTKHWFSYVPATSADLRFSDHEAYQVKLVSGGSVKLTRVEQVPAGTPLIVYSNITPSVSIADGATDDVSENLLKVSDGTTMGGSNIYALAEKNGQTAFYRVNPSVTIPAGKVYLELTASAGEMIYIEGDPSGISEVNSKENIDNNNQAWFSIDGRRLNEKPTKQGIYIHNGKKVKR